MVLMAADLPGDTVWCRILNAHQSWVVLMDFTFHEAVVTDAVLHHLLHLTSALKEPFQKSQLPML